MVYCSDTLILRLYLNGSGSHDISNAQTVWFSLRQYVLWVGLVPWSRAVPVAAQKGCVVELYRSDDPLNIKMKKRYCILSCLTGVGNRTSKCRLVFECQCSGNWEPFIDLDCFTIRFALTTHTRKVRPKPNGVERKKDQKKLNNTGAKER